MTYPFSSFLYQSEEDAVQHLLHRLDRSEKAAGEIHKQAAELVRRTRAQKTAGRLETFMQEYSLNTDEGLAMMTLAEALLRIPDALTANLLIKDKVAAATWLQRQGDTPKDWMVQATGYGMVLTRKTLDGALARLGKPVIREAMVKAMQIMSRQFVLGSTIDKAMTNARPWEKQGYRISYDMLGEAARDQQTADRYYCIYSDTIDNIAASNKKNAFEAASISVKLSSLHPRYEYRHRARCVPAIIEKLKALAIKACDANIALTVDAEEAERLNLSIDIFEAVLLSEELKDWNGFGLAVQAYQIRALSLIDYLVKRMRELNRKIHIRLVKGAYWDTEIKIAQMNGYAGYPVFTRKSNTDVSYLVCAQEMLSHPDVIHPMFATHNAHTMIAVQHMARTKGAAFEFQRLHGMGAGLYKGILTADVTASIYAPVGPNEDLLPYLVRRLLENGANSSFINQLMDKTLSAEEITQDPVQRIMLRDTFLHPDIPLPSAMFGKERKNSNGLDMSHPLDIDPVEAFVAGYDFKRDTASIIDGDSCKNPGADDRERAIASAKNAHRPWNRTVVAKRADMIDAFADMLEEHRDTLMAILAHEAGKTYGDTRDEVREAVDFCRYYAHQARIDFNEKGRLMPGYTGEDNRLTLQGRGVFMCISPWNFPLAIFIGQIVAALVSGNTVIAKPAPQTPSIAAFAVRLLHKAGVPTNVLHLINADGKETAGMLAHPYFSGVVFTGSTATAKKIQITLANEHTAIIPLIAETGGQNAMIVDSSALIEHVIDNVVSSAFDSAGQRCSALRVLYIQDTIADKTLALLKGAMKELRIGASTDLSVDIGRVIDYDAKARLENHIAAMDKTAKRIYQCDPNAQTLDSDLYVMPIAFEIPSIHFLDDEIFGPVLHVVRYNANHMDTVIRDINTSGYGLTFGIQTRIQARQDDIAARINAGNIYINRTTTGAVVGVQPFGGMGFSGTGPKAGGPYYLHAFATEKVVTTDTAALGGNTELMSLGE